MYNSDVETFKVNQYIFKHKKEFNIEIGVIIKEIRKKKNISLEQMSYRTMMSPSYIMQIEKGVNGITLNKFIIICNALEISPKEILEDFLYDSEKENCYINQLQNEKNISKNIIEYLKNKEM